MTYSTSCLPSTQTHFLGSADELSDMVWMAELGLPRLKKLYELDGSTMDVFNGEGGIGCRLKWDPSETEIYLYDSPRALYSKPLGRFPIVGGELQLPLIHILQTNGRSPADPFGILPGSRLRQLEENSRKTMEDILLEEDIFLEEDVINDLDGIALG